MRIKRHLQAVGPVSLWVWRMPIHLDRIVWKVYRGSDMRQFSQMTMPVSLGPVSLEKPDISKLKPVGCLMYGFVHKAQSSDWKMDPLAIPGE